MDKLATVLRNRRMVAAFVLLVVLGTLAAFALVRYKRFAGRTLFSGMVSAPLVMPEVITGLSLLLLFVAINFDRGFWSVTLAHTTFSMCFVAVVVQSRLIGVDRSLEEAAQDLGETKWSAFRLVILPLVMPGIVSALLMSFTISLDEFIIAFFLAGNEPTLPTYIFSQLRFPKSIPMIMALGTVLVGLSILLLTIAEYFRRRGVARTGQKDSGGFL